MWSIDARVLVRPASTFGSIAGRLDPIAGRTACRRPAFLTLVLACAVSLAATGISPAMTLRRPVDAPIEHAVN